MENLLVGKYMVDEKIKSGSHSQLFSGIEVEIKGKVVIKREEVNTKTPRLHCEAEIYNQLQGGVGIPQLKWFGDDHHGSNIIVTDHLGPSLEVLFHSCNKKFTLKTVLMLAGQLIDRIEFIHERGILHRDLKPSSFLLGVDENADQIYITGFGLGKQYIDPGTNTYIPYRENKNPTGTARYASLNTHRGVEQSRRDDLESLGYILMYFLRGSLPWDSLNLKFANKNQIFEKIKGKKEITTIEELCESYPPEFAAYFHYCRSLGFREKPNYKYLKSLFDEIFLLQGYQFDSMYDWALRRDLGSSTEVTHQHTGSTSGSRPPLQKTEGFASSFRSLAQAIGCGGCGPSSKSEVETNVRDQAIVSYRRSTGNGCSTSNNSRYGDNLEHISSNNAYHTLNEAVVNRETKPESSSTYVQEYY